MHNLAFFRRGGKQVERAILEGALGARNSLDGFANGLVDIT